MRTVIGFSLLLFIMADCRSDERAEQYLFLGHTYDWTSQGDKVDARLLKLPLDTFDMLLLGGDICSNTLKNPQATLPYLDSIFHITKRTTLWAYGNHDLLSGTPEQLNRFTKKNDFYTITHKEICFVVLNTNLQSYPSPNISDDDCQRMNEQFTMLKNICDTITQSKNLIIIHHHALWSKALLQQTDLAIYYNLVDTLVQFHCNPFKTFAEAAYPMLQKVARRNINVVCIAGDVGAQCKQVEFKTTDGVTFLGSGINNSVHPDYLPPYVTDLGDDYILVLTYQPQSQLLTWEFHDLNGLTKH